MLAIADGSSMLETSAAVRRRGETGPPAESDAGAEIVARRPKTIKEKGAFTDPIALSQSWTATVNYGDGSATVDLRLKSNKTFLLRHDYRRRGDFNVTVTVTNDLGESGTGLLTVIIGKKKPSRGTGRSDRPRPPHERM